MAEYAARPWKKSCDGHHILSLFASCITWIYLGPGSFSQGGMPYERWTGGTVLYLLSGELPLVARVIDRAQHGSLGRGGDRRGPSHRAPPQEPRRRRRCLVPRMGARRAHRGRARPRAYRRWPRGERRAIPPARQRLLPRGRALPAAEEQGGARRLYARRELPARRRRAHEAPTPRACGDPLRRQEPARHLRA